MNKNGFLHVAAGCFISCFALVVSAQASQLITNGGFETGDFTGWNAQTQAGSGGSLSVVSGTTAPGIGEPTVGPSGGTYYAVTGQSHPGAYALTQSFTVDPGATQVVVSFDMFANDFAGSIVPGPLSYTAGPVQFATADLLTGTANAFSTSAGVLENFYSGATLVKDGPNPYTSYSFDITSLVEGGGTFQLRFGEADNQLYFSMGVDNVSVTETSSTPEPATFFLIVPVLGGLAALKRKYSRA